MISEIILKTGIILCKINISGIIPKTGIILCKIRDIWNNSKDHEIAFRFHGFLSDFFSCRDSEKSVLRVCVFLL